MNVIVTVPPYADYLHELTKFPQVVGVRLNTVMPVRGQLEETLARLAAPGLPLWVDLKGRQLRVVGAAIPPFTHVQLSHPIEVTTPTEVYFNDGKATGKIVAVDGDRIILEDGPRRFVGPGESLNIPHPSLKIQGSLTETDRGYLKAMGNLGLTGVMLSYCESRADIEEVERLLPGAEVIAKIESERGLDAAERGAFVGRRLLAARGDLFVEVSAPHRILDALQRIVEQDPRAIAASRFFSSLGRGEALECSCLTDVWCLGQMGYGTLMLGDELCLRWSSLEQALRILRELGEPLRQKVFSP